MLPRGLHYITLDYQATRVRRETSIGRENLMRWGAYFHAARNIRDAHGEGVPARGWTLISAIDAEGRGGCCQVVACTCGQHLVTARDAFLDDTESCRIQRGQLGRAFAFARRHDLTHVQVKCTCGILCLNQTIFAVNPRCTVIFARRFRCFCIVLMAGCP